MGEKPNVLLLCTDQQQARALGVADETFETPHLDRLAADGVRFTECYTTSPQCSPARSSLVTGQFPHQTGLYSLWGGYGGPLDPALPSVGRHFRNAGYRTVYIGKWHLGGGDPVSHLQSFGWEETANAHTVANPPEGTPADTTTRDEAVTFLSAYDGEEPFFLTASFNLPHPGFYEDPGFAHWYDREDVPMPKSFADDLSDKPAFHRERSRELDLDEEAVRDMRYRYRTMTSRVDDHVGRILDELSAQGLREDTIVVFTSDHGDMQGAHRLSLKGVVAYEELLRVPLLVDVPDRDTARNVIPDLVSWTAIPGTLLDAAGLPYDAFEGGSVLPALDRDAPPVDEQVFFEHKAAYWGHHPYRGVRTREWKYVENMLDERDELYHVATDPHELHNLSGAPSYENAEAALRSAVDEWWDRTDGDAESWLGPLAE
ncbi:sulfatase family protein [Halomontanus rarus]|uniref:sulfatase family protein n=1 Tax=Halomontanus rarus TaxID=3034020 RepID=UPI0023E76C56|nr:sulfatase-like hydrolase/transferase [Halovivax sp. TS33]